MSSTFAAFTASAVSSSSRQLFWAAGRRGCWAQHRRVFSTTGTVCARGFADPHPPLQPEHRPFLANKSLLCSQKRWLSSTGTKANETSGAAEAESVSPEEPTKVEQLEFQAETRQLLDIVTHSLYTDSRVFLRELVSNASDACEKLRHLQASNSSAISTEDAQVPLEIRIDLDETTATMTITDTGIGMTREEMISNLGTIARSGSKNFMAQLQELKAKGEEASLNADPSQGIIGRFGVGFYSAFMVADEVEVRSKSAFAKNEKTPPQLWTSAGTGSYQVSNLSEEVRQSRGTSVILHVKEKYYSDYLNEKTILEILQKYSNFVNFPIYINGNRVNEQSAIWSRDPKEVTTEEYYSFYKYIANAVDEPLDIYHFRVDAPIDVKALMFVPSFHSEKYGMGRMEPGVSVYSRKVLIESKSQDILPDWMRFVKGVVDSEDLPLSISREKPQDSALMAKLRRALVRKFIAHLTKMIKDDPSKYKEEFYKEYSYFLKEGICQDYEWQAPLAKLLYYFTSKDMSKPRSLDEYVSSMRPEQTEIYYLLSPTRDAALQSPYLEAFEKAGVEVLFLFSTIDEFVVANLDSYEGRKLVSVEKGDIDLSALMKDEDDEKDSENKVPEKKSIYAADRELSSEEYVELCEWMRKELGEKKVATVTVTKRLSNSPAIVIDNESGAVRRMMKFVETSSDSQRLRDSDVLPRQHLEINPKHAVIVGMYDLMKKGEKTLATVLVEQIFDNSLVAAGLMDDSRSMLPRINDILLCVVNGAKAQGKGKFSDSDSSSDDEKEGKGKEEEKSSSSDDDEGKGKEVENKAGEKK